MFEKFQNMSIEDQKEFLWKWAERVGYPVCVSVALGYVLWMLLSQQLELQALQIERQIKFVDTIEATSREQAVSLEVIAESIQKTNEVQEEQLRTLKSMGDIFQGEHSKTREALHQEHEKTRGVNSSEHEKTRATIRGNPQTSIGDSTNDKVFIATDSDTGIDLGGG